MPETLTYEALYDILRRERTRQELQKLDNNFYKEVDNYIKEKIKTLESQRQKSSIFAQKEIEKTEKQLDNVKKIVKELYEKREIKITQLALSMAKTKDMQEVVELLPEERDTFENLVKTLREGREIVMYNLIEGKPKVIKTDNETKLIRFIQAVPKFVAEDSNEYGPFEEEYIASLPLKVADILVKNDRAEVL
ncbi:MAG: hypothetical protein AABW56_01430 [Nanoarchaeota archaeon]